MNDLEISSDAIETEDLWSKVGANINALLDESAAGTTDITASGSFTTPEGKTLIFIEGVGGGGGGAGGNVAFGSAGGNAGRIYKGYLPVAGNTLYSVTIGAGGAGGGAGAVGGTGANTTFGSLLTISGGFRGNAAGVAPGITYIQGGMSGGVGGVAPATSAGSPDKVAQGNGEGGPGVGTSGGGGGGGYGSVGGGGAGGTSGVAGGAASGANSGSGGGGGGNLTTTGGAGTGGFMRIILV